MKFTRRNLVFQVVKCGTLLTIDTPGTDGPDDFSFSYMPEMYRTARGIGLQCNDESKREILLKMCRKIAEAVMGDHERNNPERF